MGVTGSICLLESLGFRLGKPLPLKITEKSNQLIVNVSSYVTNKILSKSIARTIDIVRNRIDQEV